MNQPARQPERGSEPFPYELLVSFWQNELRDPDRRAVVAHWIENDTRWKAHWESLRWFEAERAAALQDAKDLENFPAGEVREFCMLVAQTGGRIFDALIEGQDRAGPHTREEWDQETDRCVYCRRMLRQVQARASAAAVGLPEGETLVRDWLLGPYYNEPLQKATQRVLAAREPTLRRDI